MVLIFSYLASQYINISPISLIWIENRSQFSTMEIAPPLYSHFPLLSDDDIPLHVRKPECQSRPAFAISGASLRDDNQSSFISKKHWRYMACRQLQNKSHICILWNGICFDPAAASSLRSNHHWRPIDLPDLFRRWMLLSAFLGPMHHMHHMHQINDLISFESDFLKKIREFHQDIHRLDGRLLRETSSMILDKSH
jgi:hypothetical protein